MTTLSMQIPLVAKGKITPEIAGMVADDFNANELEQYQNRKGKQFKTARAEAVGKKVFVRVKFDGGIGIDDIAYAIGFVDGQCSDGWGEGFEQYPHGGLFISTWRMGWREKHPPVVTE